MENFERKSRCADHDEKLKFKQRSTANHFQKNDLFKLRIVSEIWVYAKTRRDAQFEIEDDPNLEKYDIVSIDLIERRYNTFENQIFFKDECDETNKLIGINKNGRE